MSMRRCGVSKCWAGMGASSRSTPRTQLVQNGSREPEAQRTLSVSYSGIGEALTQLGDFKGALQAYRDSLGIFQGLAQDNPAGTQSQDDLQFLARRIGVLAYRFVLARDFAAGLDAADQAAAIAPEQLWIHGNRAHALMLLGRVDEARTIYLRHRGSKNVIAEKPWEALVLEDIAELRKAGIAHPLMDEVEAKLATSG
jgi:tetratricopeptide (TPR) repeat protein